MIVTLFFRYDGIGLPNSVVMRSFFVPVACLALAATFGLWHRAMVPIAAAAVVAAALGIPALPSYRATSWLPLLGDLRFRMGSMRVVLLFGIVMLAAQVVSRGLEGYGAHLGRVARSGSVAAQVGLVALVVWSGERYLDSFDDWAVPLVFAVCSAGVVSWTLIGRGDGAQWRQAGTALLALTLAGGAQWAFAFTIDNVVYSPWRLNREAQETGYWSGESASGLAGLYAPPVADVQRGSRRGFVAGDSPLRYEYDAAFYSGDLAVGGTVNLKGQPAYEALSAALADPGRFGAAMAVLTAPGIGVQVAGPGSLPRVGRTARCVADGQCGKDVVVEPVAYTPGDLTYRVTAAKRARILFNESYYPGWKLRACPAGAQQSDAAPLAERRSAEVAQFARPAGTAACRALRSALGGAGLVEAIVPAGDWLVTLAYTPSHRLRYTAAFGVGVLGALIWPFVFVPPARLSGRSRSRPRPASSPGSGGVLDSRSSLLSP
jgi:hypothetical protein